MKLISGLIIACAVLVAVAVTSIAGGRKVMVLPVDGDADPALRAKLDTSVQKLAHGIDGNITTGSTTFADAALSVGCNPELGTCVDTVIGMLQVDELVWGTANTTDGTTTLTIKRATKGVPAREQQTTLAATDPPEKAEEGLKPLFGPPAAVGSGSEVGSGSGSGSAEPAKPWSTEKKLGVGLSAGGGLALVIGFALWAEASSYNSQISSAPTNTITDINKLKSLESSASTYATWGDIMVVVGLAAGGVGAYYLWQNHKNNITVAPTPVDNGQGVGLVVGGHW